MTPPTRSFASDNNASIHPLILKAIEAANQGHAVAYGDDPHTQATEEKFRAIFGEKTQSFFVFNGTGANVLALSALTRPYHAVICSKWAHIAQDECGAPEKATGCKLISLPTPDGKLTRELVATALHGIGDQHHVQPRVLSLTQSTELGTVYSAQELRALCAFARENGLYVHLDGARVANAAAALGMGLREITGDLGVDVLSFGGTKNGLMLGEAVVFFNAELARDFKFYRKQNMQLSSKMRFIAAQFNALLGDGLWLRNAEHANAQARLLAAQVLRLEQKGLPIKIARPVHANALFAQLPQTAVQALQKEFFFYVWDPAPQGAPQDWVEVRWMTSFDTEPADIERFTLRLEHFISSKS